MRTRIGMVVLSSLLAACASAVPAQAGEFHCGWGFVNPHYSTGLHLGFFSFGSHLGLGPGYPGLYPPYPSLHPYFYTPSCPQVAAPIRAIALIPSRPLQIHARGSERRVAQSDAATRGSSSTPVPGGYDSVFERVRKLYPRGLPPIEQVWTDGQTSEP